MRPSALSKAPKAYRSLECARTFATTPKKRVSSLSTTCQICGRNRPQSKNHSAVTTYYQRRWQSQNAPAQKVSNEAASNTPSTPQTHYDFFPETLSSGPPPSGSFAIDLKALRREFLQLQAIAHPDRHPQHLKTRAEATSARINEAYKTLQSPLLRAQYLLHLRGIDIAGDETAKVDDPVLLMEVLETREEIEAAREEEELVELKAVNEERIEASEKILEEAFKADDIEKAKKECVKLRYWINIKESLDNWEKGRPIVLEH
ncbi:Fe-S protein assembly co-chaperone HscB [Xylogone sp. PMI_703]|nr:Fe-S protein assembly co-chaperone HscB [Xylogone sp. PMI_703]